MKVMVSLSSPTIEMLPFTGGNGAYVSVIPTKATAALLSSLAEALGVKPDPSKFHITVLYSKDATPNSVETDPAKKYDAQLNEVEIFRGSDDKKYLTAKLQSDALQKRHKVWIGRGAKHSYDDLMLHVTLWTDIDETPQLTNRISSINRRLAAKPASCQFHQETVSDLKD